MEKKIVSFYTLGCKVNQYETQALKEQFTACGFEVLKDDASGTMAEEAAPQRADVYVINTCTVTSLSDKKSRQYIRRAKKKNPDSVVAVIGCFAQTSPEEASGIEGVDIVAGTNEKNRLPDLVKQYKDTQLIAVKSREELIKYEDTGAIVSMDSRVRAFMKIQEGCNRFCSYCIIPYARGQVRSRHLTDIIKEAEKLIERGFKELVITGINTALYSSGEGGFAGEDSGQELSGIEEVIAALDALPGDFRIRLGSLEPTVIHVDYAKRLLQYKKLCPHMHLSAQSGSDRVLAEMNRHYTQREYREILSVLKAHDPGYGITTDIIAGFPGESESDFQESVRMVEEAEFCKTHVFQYSRRKGTKAAEMKDQVPAKVKAQRSKALMEAAKESSRRFFEKNKGGIRTVLVEEAIKGEHLEKGVLQEERELSDAATRKNDSSLVVLTGHTENYIKVYFSGSEDLINTFCRVKLTGLCQDGMTGEIVG